MSQDFEDFMKSQALKEPSADLDKRVLGLFDQQEELPEVKVFPWRKFATYAVAAMLFLAVGITELVQRYGADADSGAITKAPVSQGSTSSAAVPTVNVSTSENNHLSRQKELLQKMERLRVLQI